MASVSVSFPILLSCSDHTRSTTCRTSVPAISPPSLPLASLRLKASLVLQRGRSARAAKWNLRAVAEEEAAVPLADEKGDAEAAEQPVSVPVSPSDILTMFFKAEGTMSESAITTVTKSLEEAEGISDLKVQVLEGIASVELTKQTTVQATGVASNLVEIIQGSGFKLQALNLSFDEEEEA